MVPSADAKPLAPPAEEKKEKPKKSSGLAKGFFLGPRKKEPKVEDLSHIKARPKEDALKLAEIEAMKREVAETQSQWLTPELLKQIAGSEKLRRAMQDPIFLQVQLPHAV